MTTSNPSECMNTLMEKIQNTTGLSSSDSEDEVAAVIQEGHDDVDDSLVTCVKCNGAFPSDQEGAEFTYAMLCAACFGLSRAASSNDADGDDGNKQKKDDDADSSSMEMRTIHELTNVSESDDNNSSSQCGCEMGLVLSNIRANKIDRYDVIVGGNELGFQYVENAQDNIERNNKRFFSVIPDSTPILYGFKHYQGFLNLTSKKGWLGHCRLSSNKVGAEGDGSVLWEFWLTRCNRPRLDGIVVNENGEIQLVKNIQKWLTDNSLSSDLLKSYDHDFFEDAFKQWLNVSRWIYNSDHGIPIETKNPQASRKIVTIMEDREADDTMGGLFTTDGVNVRSSRLLSKQQRHKQAQDEEKANEKSLSDNDTAKKANADKGKRKRPTAAPVWTPKLDKKLTLLCKKHKLIGKTGTSWVKVSDEIKISRYHCINRWKELQAAVSTYISSSSGSENEDDASPLIATKQHDMMKTGSDAKLDKLLSLFQEKDSKVEALQSKVSDLSELVSNLTEKKSNSTGTKNHRLELSAAKVDEESDDEKSGPQKKEKVSVSQEQQEEEET